MTTLIMKYANADWVASPKQIDESHSKATQLALCFGSKEVIGQKGFYETAKARFPIADILMCSTSGEILNDEILENQAVAAALNFKNSTTRAISVNIANFNTSFDAGQHLAKALTNQDLKYIMVFSDGSLINGSELVKGLNFKVENHVLVSGGLAGDGAQFESTLVGLNKQPKEGEIVAIGFYGKDLFVSCGSQSGWEPFGLEKRITKSNKNVLYELEEQNALEIYKKYLGAEKDNLPSSALLFPLSIFIPGSKQAIIRTILSIDEEEKSMTFAGDMPEGSVVRFMASTHEKLVDAAYKAANDSKTEGQIPSFALLVSCIGRKLVMGPKAVDEISAIKKGLNEQTKLIGFYSYGEIAPFKNESNCQLHNQTMTITAFFEKN